MLCVNLLDRMDSIERLTDELKHFYDLGYEPEMALINPRKGYTFSIPLSCQTCFLRGGTIGLINFTLWWLDRTTTSRNTG